MRKASDAILAPLLDWLGAQCATGTGRKRSEYRPYPSFSA